MPQGDILTAAYEYDLPPELIAQTPIEPRDASRLLVIDRSTGAVQHRLFRDLPDLLSPGDLMVANRSRVIPARLQGRRLPTGGAAEILLLRRLADGDWDALVRPGKRLAVGSRIGFGERDIFAEIAGRGEAGERTVRFVDAAGKPLADATFDRWLVHAGAMPLPPYIHEPLADAERYQTVYARDPGSAAAPTAGLHFTPELLFRLRDRGIGLAHVTLHVGLDTFRRVEVEDVRHHRIHSEWCELTEESAKRIADARRRVGRIVAVGTTAVRVLESTGGRPFVGDTRLFIHPGHEFEVVDALITNFHLPRSSLLMLVSAFAGRERVLAAYEEAIRERYRFYSFGDAMLLL